MKIKLQDLVIDPTIQVRSVCSQTVADYRQAYRSGAKFPNLEVEKGTNRIVSGNHRYFVFKSELEPDSLIDCKVISFKTEADLIKHAARDNSTHGRPLATFDKKRIILRLKDLGVTDSEIASTLSITEKKLLKLAGMTVCVLGGTQKKPYRRVAALKRGLEHLKGKEITEDQYQEHEKCDRGVQASSMASALLRWIENGWISTDEITMAKMSDLYTALGALLDGDTRMVK